MNPDAIARRTQALDTLAARLTWIMLAFLVLGGLIGWGVLAYVAIGGTMDDPATGAMLARIAVGLVAGSAVLALGIGHVKGRAEAMWWQNFHAERTRPTSRHLH